MINLAEFCVVDIECYKVAAPSSWSQRTRFKTFMVGVGWWSPDEKFMTQMFMGDDEAQLLEEVERFIDGFCYVAYYATRDFDRHVLEGRWTNARRALSDEKGDWPTITDRPDEDWVNLRTDPRTKGVDFERFGRDGDIPSKDIASFKSMNDPRVGDVVKHNWMDVVELGRLIEASKEHEND